MLYIPAILLNFFFLCNRISKICLTVTSYLGVADYNPNAIGVSDADEFYCVSTIDEIGVYEAAKQFRADAVVTMATDMPMRSGFCKIDAPNTSTLFSSIFSYLIFIYIFST